MLQTAKMDINFHQRPHDDEERYWSFTLNQGSFFDYFVNRIQWYEYPRNFFVVDFPLHVDIEVTNKCNMNCPMCYRKNMGNLGYMDWDVFTKIVDECAENDVFSVRLSWRGESLTHPNIKEMIRYSTSNITNVSFLTNVLYVNEEMAEHLIDCQLSYISVSFDGLGDIYNQVRRPAKYEDSYNKLRYLQEAKARRGSLKPQVRVCTLWPAIKDDPHEYYRVMSQVADYVVVNNYKNFRAEPNPVLNFICQYPWERIVISQDGVAQCCTGWNSEDVSLGNVRDHSVKEMWHSEKMQYIRRMHRTNHRLEIPGCSICRHGNTLPDQGISIQEIIKRGY